MVRDLASYSIRLYTDGLLVTNAPLTEVNDGALRDEDGEADPFTIGAHRNPNLLGMGEYFFGKIDEMMLYDRALSADDVASVYVAQGGQPRLSVSRSLGDVRLLWPSCAQDYGLEYADILSSSQWFPVTNTVQLVGSSKYVALPSDSQQRYYRLAK